MSFLVEPSIDGILADIAGTLSTWFTSTTNGKSFPNDVTLEWVKLNNIAPTGKYNNPAHPHVYYYPSARTGPVASGGLVPWYMSPAYTFTTALSRGPGSHGRAFLPVGVGSAHSPIMDSTTQSALITHAKAMLNAIRRAPSGAGAGDGVIPVVASSRGVTQPITGVRIGNVIDVQRRRRNAWAETYVAATYP
jgi:hypothetical protein